MNFRLEVFIGNCFIYKNEKAIGCACLPNDCFIPGHKRIIEFESFHSLGTYVADFVDFYNESLDKNVYKKIAVTIFLNAKSNHKVFYGYDAVDVIDSIGRHYDKKLRSFDIY